MRNCANRLNVVPRRRTVCVIADPKVYTGIVAGPLRRGPGNCFMIFVTVHSDESAVIVSVQVTTKPEYQLHAIC